MNTLKFKFLIVIGLGLILNLEAQNKSTNDIYYTSELNSSGRDIYKMNSDGTKQIKLTRKHGTGHYPHNNCPKLSPDGTKIAYHSDTDSHDRYAIWTMNIDGSNQKRITEKEGLFAEWSPDGKTLIFSGRRNGVWEILMIPSNGGEESNLSNNFRKAKKPGWGAICSYHPNGKSIVYTHVREKVLYAMDLETNVIKQLSPSNHKYTNPAFSKDGLSIAVIRKISDSYDLITISPDGKNGKVIAKKALSYSRPAWSNSGKELLFVGMVNKNQEIFKINIETGEEIQLTNNSDFDAMPTW